MLTLASYTQDQTKIFDDYAKMNINPHAKLAKLIQLRDDMIKRIEAIKLYMSELKISNDVDNLIHSTLKEEVYHMDMFTTAADLHIENLKTDLEPNYVYVGRA